MAKRVRSGGRPAKRVQGRRPSPPPPVRRAPDPAPGSSPSASAEPISLLDDGADLDIGEGDEDAPRASSAHLTDSELRRTEELQEELRARERAAMADQIRQRTREREVRESAPVAAGDVNAPLRVRAAHEYAYVARDVRRIIMTGGLMVAILAVLAILINVLGVISI